MIKLRVQSSLLIVIFSFVFLLTNNYQLITIYAADSTPSADIKSKLVELKKEIASKAAKIKQEIDRKLRDKAYIGKVKTKSDSAITLATKNGPRIVNINQDSEFDSNIKGKKYSQKLVSEEDYIASLGDVDETGVLTAKKVILLDPRTYTLNPKTYLWGQVVAISDKLVTIKDRDLKSIAVSTTSSNVKTLDFVILTGNMGKNDIFQADFVYVIPHGGILKPKKIATSSAQPASPSATRSRLKPVSR